MRLLNAAACAAFAVIASGCATTALTPTTDTRHELVRYEITGIAYADAADAVTNTIRRNMSSANIQRNFSPETLPEEPGSMRLVDPLAGTAMGGFAAMAGGQLRMGMCDDAQLVVNYDRAGFRQYGENTRYTACLWEHAQGVRMEIYSAFSQQSGMNTAQISRQLMSNVIGDSSQFIERSRQFVVDALEEEGARVEELSRQST